MDRLLDKRPWGTYIVLHRGSGFQVKLITINPEERISLQRHYHRFESWFIVKGTAKVTLGNDNYLSNSELTIKYFSEGDRISIYKTQLHRIENPGKIPLLFIEIQLGNYLDEDDIVRIEDDYDRVQA